MLVMHGDLSASSAGLPVLIKREDTRSLPVLLKRDETRSLRWQETPLYPPETTLPLPLPLPLTAMSESESLKKKQGNKQVFICTEVHCGKQFPRSFALRRHMRIHTGTKPYGCDFDGCTQRFNTSGNLSRHKRIHSGERPYPCIFTSCGKRFNTSTKLKRHMRIHFPEGQRLFRCLALKCDWSCDNYKEYVQHQKLHHNLILGAHQEPVNAPQPQGLQDHTHHAVGEASCDQDNTYCSTPDSTREYATESLSYGNHHVSTAPSGGFVYTSSYDKPKTSLQASLRSKFMGPPLFFGSDQSGNLATMLHKDPSKKSTELEHLYGSDHRRMKPSNAFPSVQYSTPGGSFAINSDSALTRPTFMTYSSHFAPLRLEDERGQSGHYEPIPPHQLLPPPGNPVLRPPPEDSKYSGYAVPPPMNPAAPEFTGEELNVVLQLMNETY